MEQSNLQSLIYETDQAIQAGQAAHVQAQQALSTLRSAKGWGVYDLLGGGLLSGLIKHSRMDKAEQEIAQLRRALDRFNRELRDVRVRCDASRLSSTRYCVLQKELRICFPTHRSRLLPVPW